MPRKILFVLNFLSHFNDKYFMYIAYVYKLILGLVILFYLYLRGEENTMQFVICLLLLIISLFMALKFEKHIDFFSFVQNLTVMIYVGESALKNVPLDKEFISLLCSLIIWIMNENYMKLYVKIIHFLVSLNYLQIVILKSTSIFLLFLLIFVTIYSIYNSWVLAKTLQDEKQMFKENKEFIKLYEEIIKNYPSNLISFEKNPIQNDFPFELKFSNDSAKKEFTIIDNASLSQLLQDVHLNTNDLLILDHPQEIGSTLKEVNLQKKRLLDTCVSNEDCEISEKRNSNTITKKFLTSYNPKNKSLKKEERLNRNYRIFIVRFCYKDKVTFLLSLENIHLEEEILHLKQMDKIKDDTLASITHDLRSPLSSMLKWIEYAKESPNIEENHKNLELASNNGNMLMNLINDILDYSLIKHGKFKLNHTKFNLDSLIQESINLMKIQADYKEITIKNQNKCPQTLIITSDFTRIKQILYNLIGNSIKFTAKGGEIILSVSYVSHDKSVIKFIVSDNGIGIKPEIIPKLCQPFHSYDYAGNFNKHGVGLGLHICKTIIGQLGPSDKLEIEAVFEKGSTFSFEIFVNCFLQTNQKGKFITSDQLQEFQKMQIEEEIIKKNKDFIIEMTSFYSKENDKIQSEDFIEAHSNKNLPYHKEHSKKTVLNENYLEDLLPIYKNKDIVMEREIKENKVISQNLICINSVNEKYLKNSNKNSNESGGNQASIQRNSFSSMNEKSLNSRRNSLENNSNRTSIQRIFKFNINVLIADDDGFNLMIMKMIFSKFTLEFVVLNIEQAFNGEEAVKIFEKRNFHESKSPFDIIFMDCLMPIKDGFRATYEIKELIQNNNFCKCIIIGCTSFQDDEKCLFYGMDKVLLKPIENNKVFEILNNFLHEKFHI